MAFDEEKSFQAKYVYVILTQTSTYFASTIRRIMRRKYNHASISFCSDLSEVYAFGRYRHKAPILAGLIHEYPDRMSLRKKDNVPCLIYKIPVTQVNYQKGLDKISEITNDSDGYLYNLFSVLTYPLTKGFRTYKAFSCSEFVAYMLNHMEVEGIEKQTYRYTPWGLSEILEKYKCYEGDLLPLIEKSRRDEIDYFSNVNYLTVTGRSVKTIAELMCRRYRH